MIPDHLTPLQVCCLIAIVLEPRASLAIRYGDGTWIAEVTKGHETLAVARSPRGADVALELLETELVRVAKKRAQEYRSAAMVELDPGEATWLERAAEELEGCCEAADREAA
jgi:hypothetical protein